MGRLAFLVGLLLAGGVASAGGPPEYSDDPFDDADFAGAPLILEVNHPLAGTGEVSVMFSSSLIGKYSSHLGGLVDLTYNVTETLGLGVSVGMLHGQLTTIVTGEQGIIENAVGECLRPESTGCDGIQPQVPDYKQVTGVADLLVVWSPLYGKLNFVSEAGVNVRIYGLAGLGINGTREVMASLPPGAGPGNGRRDNFSLTGGGLLEGGSFADTRVNATAGVGLKVYLLEWLALRAEARGIFFTDTFAFNEDGVEETYLSRYWFGQAGLAFTLF